MSEVEDMFLMGGVGIGEGGVGLVGLVSGGEEEKLKLRFEGEILFAALLKKYKQYCST